ncbi:ABC transporter ATP-binding protein [Micromonospora sp. WMMD714]|uniref:ATP-binding cassette domain-containing protein n=1 Tax=Micromonospora sp. WMMD714 TaxID=3016097 RepID=UPI00249A97D4|nr:ABC transporter ATP-binding protein [Micromonospora sp. WMMD714]WFE65720.1 ABC transporter ATP-binding protein [Micromonospora sp. WMMD714]
MTTVTGMTRAALRDRRAQLWRLAGWSAAEVLPAALSGLLTAHAVDSGFLAGRPGVGLAWLALLGLAVLVGAAGTHRSYALLGEVVEPFRDDLLRRVVRGAVAGAAGGRADDAAVARLTHQVELVRDTYAGLLMVVRGFLFAFGAAVLGLLSLAAPVALVVAVPVLAGLGLFAVALPVMVARQREYVLSDERLGRAVVTAVTGHRDVTASGARDRVTDWVGASVDAQARVERRLATMAATRGLTLALGGWLPVPALLLATPWLVRQGLGPGAVLGALVYVTRGVQPALHSLVQGVAAGGLRFAVTLDRLLKAAASFDGTTDRPGPPPAPSASPGAAVACGSASCGSAGGDAACPGAGGTVGCGSTGSLAPPTAPRAGSALSLRAVTFRYGPHADPVLDHLDLEVPAGDHLVIVGASGIGKSTLAGLVAGVLHPQSGTVHVGGSPVAGATPRQLADRRVLIPQEAYVFTGTLRENIDYLVPGLPDDAMDRAAARLGLTGLLARLGGYDALLRPADLSAGERQQLALLRAWLSPAALVILDEATCHLDPATEARLEGAFAARPGTLVVIAHRVSSALRARRVLLLDGRAALLDTHQGLLARSPAYRALVGYGDQGTTLPEAVTTNPTRGRSAPLPSGSAPRSSP